MKISIFVTRAGATTNLAESVGPRRRQQSISRQTLILCDVSRIAWFGARCPYTGWTCCRDPFLILWELGHVLSFLEQKNNNPLGVFVPAEQLLSGGLVPSGLEYTRAQVDSFLKGRSFINLSSDGPTPFFLHSSYCLKEWHLPHTPWPWGRLSLLGLPQSRPLEESLLHPLWSYRCRWLPDVLQLFSINRYLVKKSVSGCEVLKCLYSNFEYAEGACWRVLNFKIQVPPGSSTFLLTFSTGG